MAKAGINMAKLMHNAARDPYFKFMADYERDRVGSASRKDARSLNIKPAKRQKARKGTR